MDESQMRIVYYTSPSFFDASLCLIRSLSEKVDLHVILEVSPENRRSTILDLTSTALKSGITPADAILCSMLPEKVREYWENTASFHLAVFNNQRSIHPDTLKQVQVISRFIEEIQPDLIYFNNSSLRIALGSFIFKRGIWVIGVHDPQPHSGEGDWRNSLSRKLMFRKASKFVLHNKSQKSSFLTDYSLSQKQVSVIRLGVYDVYRNWERTHYDEEGRNILFFGRLSPYKGLEVLLNASSLVCQEISNLKINIVGEPRRGYSLPPIPSLPNGGNINIVKRYVSTGELVRYFNEASCVVCPYIDATQSGVVLTAYAFNKPVVATRVGGLPEYVHDKQTGLLVEPGNPKALSESIVQIIENNRLRRKLQQGILDIEEASMNWELISKKYLEIFGGLTKDC